MAIDDFIKSSKKIITKINTDGENKVNYCLVSPHYTGLGENRAIA